MGLISRRHERLHGGMENENQDHLGSEERAIMDAIKAECDAFYARDYERWASYWYQSGGTQRLATLGNGQIFCNRGWASVSGTVQRIMAEDPEPNLRDGDLMRRENVYVRVSGDMAWVSFDQLGPVSDDVFVKSGLSHEVRVLVRDQGRWKVEHSAHAHVRLDHYECPTVQVEPDGTVIWMNKMAEDSMATHQTLKVSGGVLRAREPADAQILRETLQAVAQVTPMDVRRKSGSPRAGGEAVPLVLGGDFVEATQIVWVLHRDQMCLVSFNDAATEKRRLTQAKAVFGLSDAQMRLAESIVAGNDIVSTAQDLGISAATARTHLQRMFDKTGVRSQTALVRLLLDASKPSD